MTQSWPWRPVSWRIFRARYQERCKSPTAGRRGSCNRLITPPIIISAELILKGLDIIEDAVAEVEQRFGDTKGQSVQGKGPPRSPLPAGQVGHHGGHGLRGITLERYVADAPAVPQLLQVVLDP